MFDEGARDGRTLRPSKARAALLALFGLAAALVACCPGPAAWAEGTPGARFALVIGNAGYQDGKLQTSLNDARAMADALHGLGFTVSTGENLGRKEMTAAIAAFREKIRPDSVAVFYYSGHAVQVAKRNYLLPVDAAMSSAVDVLTEAVATTTIFDQLAPVAPGARMIILDASRANPMELRFRGFSAGLAAVDAPSGFLFAHAAAPSKVVPDTEEDVSIFTGELVSALHLPGLRLDAILDKVRDRVRETAKGDQVPWSASGVDPGLVLNAAAPPAPPAPVPVKPAPPAPVAALPSPPAPVAPPPEPVVPVPAAPVTVPPAPVATAPAPPATAAPSTDTIEVVFWESIRDSKNPADFKAYLSAFPEGRFAALARIRIAPEPLAPPPPQVEQAAIPVAPPPPVEPSKPSRPGTTADCDNCPEMIAVPAGTFDMGSNEGEPFERPRHAVAIRKPFAIGRSEVTFDEWAACTAAGACSVTPADRGWGRGSRPVINLSWDDTMEYVAFLSKRSGKTYRLPSEAEWEYAARGGTQTPYVWGDKVGIGNASCHGCGGPAAGQSAPVGSFAPNAFGLVDMSGNVAEWVQDCWHDGYKGAPADGSPWVGKPCQEHVLRGGSFASGPAYVRTWSRFHYDGDVRYYANGFRVARDEP